MQLCYDSISQYQIFVSTRFLKKKINTLDYTVDCTGNTKVIQTLLGTTKFFGGKLLIIGNPNPQEKIMINPWQIILGKTLLGAWNDNKSFEKKFYKFHFQTFEFL